MTNTRINLDRLRDFDVILAPSLAEATALGARAARELPGGLMFCAITTFDGWLERLWEQYGDGRSFVGRSSRVLAMENAIERLGSPDLPLRPHTAIAVSDAHRRASGLAAYERALVGERPDVRLDAAERAVLEACASYDESLERMGLVEPGRAAWTLAQEAGLVTARPLRVGVVGTAPCTPLQHEFFAAGEGAGWLRVTRLEGEAAGAVSKPSDGVDLRFAFPSGRYARPQLLLDVVGQLGQAGPVVVSAKDPAALYDAVAPALTARGVTCAMRGSRRFDHTAFGRAYCSLAAAYATRDALPWNEAALADVLSTPVTRRPRSDAWKWDESVRGDRLEPFEDAVQRLFDSDEDLHTLLDVVEAPDFRDLNSMDAIIERARGLSPAERDEQHDAVNVLRELVFQAENLGIGPEGFSKTARDLLQNCSVGVRGANARLKEGVRPDVLIEGFAEAATAEAGSCATMVVLDLDVESYPAARKEDACALLLGKLDVPPEEDRLSRLRRQFNALVAAPTKNLVLGRCLNDVDGFPTYPCAVMEEFVGLYRTGDPDADDVRNVYALPESLRRSMFLRGEENLLANVAPGADASPTTEPVPAVSESERLNLLVHRRKVVKPDEPLRLSPAQIEAYLKCPGYWQATRRLSTNAPDELFGPREQGEYRHDVMQGFYELFRERGHDKVSPDNLAEARAVLDEVIRREDARALECDDDARPVHALDRCVPIPGSTEERTMARIRDELREWLLFEAEFLRGPRDGEHPDDSRVFIPRDFELDIGTFDIPFAGAVLTGRIDRVDVSRDGSSAVVVDYKGRLSADYELDPKKGLRCESNKKIQALVYASAINASPGLREHLGLPDGTEPCVAGALYVSYLRGNAVRGHYDEASLMPGKNAPSDMGGKSLSAESLSGLLEQVEEDVAALVVEPLLAGKVDPTPSREACTWCPNVGCALRRN